MTIIINLKVPILLLNIAIKVNLVTITILGDLGQLIKKKKHIEEMEAIKIMKHIVNGFKE